MTRFELCTAQDATELELRRQVESFYTFDFDPRLAVGPQSPCTFRQGAQLARPKWPVMTLDPEDHAHSTCPWRATVDEDETGGRFPCRIASAELNEANTSGGHTYCVARVTPRQRRYRRHNGKICQPLLQQLPVLERDLGENGEFQYSVRNISVSVGFTCVFEDRFF